MVKVPQKQERHHKSDLNLGESVDWFVKLKDHHTKHQLSHQEHAIVVPDSIRSGLHAFIHASVDFIVDVLQVFTP